MPFAWVGSRDNSGGRLGRGESVSDMRPAAGSGNWRRGRGIAGRVPASANIELTAAVPTGEVVNGSEDAESRNEPR